MHIHDEPPVPEFCEVCGEHPDKCRCPECPVCGEFGRMDCYVKDGHMKLKGEFNVINAPLLGSVFEDYSSPYDLYHSLYRYSNCGVTVGMRFALWHDNHDRYNSDLPDKWTDGDFISHLLVSSIVEGCDEGTMLVEVPIGDIATLNARLHKAIERVEAEAENIWNESHGCFSCFRHWKRTTDCYDKGDKYINLAGTVPVWTDCPNCEGRGVIL